MVPLGVPIPDTVNGRRLKLEGPAVAPAGLAVGAGDDGDGYVGGELLEDIEGF